ncbi:MAG: hypothetical protein ACYDBP_04625 [Leptospirales bacterium]
MTRKALHPKTGKIVNPEEFVAISGPSWKEKGIFPVCPACKIPLSPYGPHSTKVVSRFDHPDGSDCPLSSTPDPRYAYLIPSDWDPKGARRLKEAFCPIENLKEIYAACLKICGTLSGDEFVDMCRMAERRGIFRYKGLSLWVLPYLFVTLVDLPKAGRRAQPLRLILIKPKKEFLDILWIRPQECHLAKYFADTGKPMGTTPVGIPDPDVEQARKKTDWMSHELILKIQKCCPDTHR